jgi:hypothetical protein
MRTLITLVIGLILSSYSGRSEEAIGQFGAIQGVRYTITGYSLLKTYGPYRVKPDTGTVFVRITLSAKNFNVSATDTSFDSIGLYYSTLYFPPSRKGTPFQNTEIQPTASTEGDVLFEIPVSLIGKPLSLNIGDTRSISDGVYFGNGNIDLPGLTTVADN